MRSADFAQGFACYDIGLLLVPSGGSILIAEGIDFPLFFFSARYEPKGQSGNMRPRKAPSYK